MNQPDRYFRSLGQQIATTLVMLASAAYYMVTTYPERDQPAVLIPGVIFATASLVLAIRASRMGALCSDDEFVARNLLKTLRASWDQIAEFEYGKFKYFGTTVPVARLFNGERIPIGSYFVLNENPRSMQVAQTLIDDLNSELIARRWNLPTAWRQYPYR